MKVRGSDLRAEIKNVKGMIDIVDARLKHGFSFEAEEQLQPTLVHSTLGPEITSYQALVTKYCALQVAQTAFNNATMVTIPSIGEVSLAYAIKILHFEQQLASVFKKLATTSGGEVDYRNRPVLRKSMEDVEAKPVLTRTASTEEFQKHLQAVNEISKAIGAANAMETEVTLDETCFKALQ